MSLIGPAFVVLLMCMQHIGGTTGDLRALLVAAGIQAPGVRRGVLTQDEAATQACNSAFVSGAESGSISTYGFASGVLYDGDMECEWILRAPRNKLMRIVVEFAEIPCPDSLGIFNYEDGHAAYRLETVCGPEVTNDPSNDDTAIFTDTDGAVVTFHSFPGNAIARGFSLSYTIIDPEEKPCGVPRIEPFVPGTSGDSGAGSGGLLPPPPGPLVPNMPPLPPGGANLKVIGGFETIPFSWPWHVSVSFFDITFCGGTLINKRWVLTAAHCLGDPFEEIDLTVVLGVYNTSGFTEASQQAIGITKWVMHPDFDIATYDNDIALLHLDTDVVFSPHVSPVCLPTEDAAADTMCTVTGWGATEFEFPDVLHQVNVPIIAQDICTQPSWRGENITDNMLCAGFPEGGADTCNGDSGGPLVCKEGNHWELQGITSYGLGFECGQPKSPGIYVRVTRYLDWIAAEMNAV